MENVGCSMRITPEELKRWRWNRHVENVKINQDACGSVLEVKAIGNDPFCIGPVFEEAALDKMNAFEIEGSFEGKAYIQLFWRTRDMEDFSEEASVRVLLPEGNQPKKVTVNLEGKVAWYNARQFRIDTSDSIGTTFIRRIEFKNTNQNAIGNNRSSKISLFLDIVDACNLTCPSCPRGYCKSSTSRQMTPEFAARIIEKAIKESDVQEVGLVHWGEAFLSRRLIEIMDVIGSYGLPCILSTNLSMKNIDDYLEEVIKRKPACFKVSVSGFSQEIYQRGHRNGDIELVKKNLHTLRNLLDIYDADGSINAYVAWHQYKDNEKESEKMAEYLKPLRFPFNVSPAYYLPVENCIEFIDGKVDNAYYENVVRRLLIDPSVYPYKDIFHSMYNPYCYKQEQEIVVGIDGNVYVCGCSWKHKLGNFLDLSLREIHQSRRIHPLCVQCKNRGIHLYYSLFKKIAWPKKR
jgi:MoaA/NifB/PqqE/SkfB family radical SAM enzyme